MDRRNSDCAAESSTSARQPSRSRTLKRKSRASSPLTSSPRLTQSRRKKTRRERKTAHATEVYYSVREIIGERELGKHTQFLIDWEDNPLTGETYEPTWVYFDHDPKEPYENVTEAAIAEWRGKKPARQDLNSRSSTPNILEEDSEPILPARRRLPAQLSGERATQVRNKYRTEDNEHLSSLSGTREHHGDDNERKVEEIKDSYEDEDSGIYGNVSVLIPVRKDFNPDEYIPVRSSQLSDSCHPLSQSSQLSHQPKPQKAAAPRIRKPYIWDEDIVPDSQYLSGSASYEPSALLISSGNSRAAISSPARTDQAQTERSDRDPIKGSRRTSEAPATTTSTTEAASCSELSSQEQRANVGQSAHQLIDEDNPSSLGSVSNNSKSPINLTSAPVSVALRVSKLLTRENVNHTTTSSREQQRQPASELSLIPEQTSQSTIRPSSSIPAQSHSPGPLHPPASLEIPDSFAEEGHQDSSGPVTTRSDTVNTLNKDPTATSSSPIRKSQSEIPTDSQRSQSEPVGTNINSSSEGAWQGAQLVSQLSIPRTQELLLERPSSQHSFSEPPVQVYKTQSSQSTHSESTQDHRPVAIEIAQKNSSPIVASIEQEESFGGAQPQVQEIVSSEDVTNATWSSSNSLLPGPSPIPINMERIASVSRAASSRSPSSVPSRIEPSSAHTDRLLPLRDHAHDIARSQSMSLPRVSIEPRPSSTPDYLTVRQLGRNEFIIPLPMMGPVRDVYDTTIKNMKEQIVKFLRNSPADPDVVSRMDTMLEELKLLCDHQDLVVEESSTQDLDDVAQARYAVTISTKFLFIRQFLDALRTSKSHVVIFARDPILPILEALFRSQDYSYDRPDVPGNSNVSKDPMQVTLLPTWIDPRDSLVAPASVVVAFDSSSQGEEEYHHLLPYNPRNPTKRAPLLSLVTTNSIEHLELCIPTTLDSTERKERLVEYVAQTRKAVGKLDMSIYPTPEQAAKGAAEYVVNDSPDAIWPLMPMPDIPLGLLQDGRNILSSESSAGPFFSPPEEAKTGFKRPSNFDVQEQETSMKRQRITPTRQPNDPMLNMTAAGFQEHIRNLELRCQDYETSLKRIQPQYQRVLSEAAKFKRETDEFTKREEDKNKKLERQTEVASKLRKENAKLKAELAASREALANSSNPDVKELQAAKNEIAAGQAEIERMKKSRTSIEKQLEYATNMYQQSSSEVLELRNALSSSQAEVESLRSVASSNRVQIQKLNHDSLLQQLTEQIDEMRREMAEKDRMHEKTNEKLEALLNGRITTRGTSVPRSPRMGMQNMSPRPRVLGSMGPSSRGGSPAPGMGVFGGELGVGRFGAHLQ
ncbi:HDA1 complex subunit protein [Rutstroemia sp. NJR-2017a WRK4]|nr:HDA1 complex subunit protein [Rutstroemia sp. NJR-2017a WRK4]